MNTTVFQILVTLQQEPGDSSQILERLRALAPGGSVPSVAALYRALNRAIEAAWAENDKSVAVDPPLAARGRPAQVYRITEAGRSAVAAEAERMRGLADLALGGSARNRES